MVAFVVFMTLLIEPLTSKSTKPSLDLRRQVDAIEQLDISLRPILVRSQYYMGFKQPKRPELCRQC